MNEGLPYGDIIIIALVAGFIFLRLRSILGKTDSEQNFFQPRPEEKNEKSEKPETIIQLVEKSIKPRAKPENEHDPVAASLEGTPLANEVVNIKNKDPMFNATTFLNGAKMAFEMVFDAFAKGDKPTLQMLLSAELYSDFVKDIDTRQNQENKPETTLLSVLPKQIISAGLNGNLAQIAVHFESEQVTVERGKDGQIVSGDPSDISHVRDEWLFERDVTSKNPNWKIIET